MKRFDAVPNKTLAGFFVVNMDKVILEFMWKYKGPSIANTTVKNNVWRYTSLNFKIYHNAAMINSACYWHQERHRTWEQNESRNRHTHINQWKKYFEWVVLNPVCTVQSPGEILNSTNAWVPSWNSLLIWSMVGPSY